MDCCFEAPLILPSISFYLGGFRIVFEESLVRCPDQEMCQAVAGVELGCFSSITLKYILDRARPLVICQFGLPGLNYQGLGSLQVGVQAVPDPYITPNPRDQNHEQAWSMQARARVLI